jgi:hypothetical protein
MAAQPSGRRLNRRDIVWPTQAPCDEEDMWVARGIGRKKAWLKRGPESTERARIGQATPVNRSRRGGVEIDTTAIRVQVVLQRNLRPLIIVVADQTIAWLIALFNPARGRAPVLDLRAWIVRG